LNCGTHFVFQVEGLQLFLQQSNFRESPQRDVSKCTNPEHFKWISSNRTDRKTPDQFTKTKLEHHYQLAKVRSNDLRADEATKQTTEEWLANHSLEALGLTMEQLISLGKLPPQHVEKYSERVGIGDGNVLAELKQFPPSSLIYDLQTIIEFECGLYTAISDYTARIKWLMQGTRGIFGLIRGHHVGVLIDSSNTNLAYGRERSLRRNLLQLFEEQLNEKQIQTLYLASYGTRVHTLWPCPMQINERVLDEVKTFVSTQLKPDGSTNLLAGIKHASVLPQISMTH
ncbi:hypothetical protein P879_07033, partial [Paragonimus westermani]